MTTLAVASFSLTGVATSAYFTGSANITGNTFTSGSIKLTATPATSAITMAGMTPGDKVTAAITVTNSGTLPQLYAVVSVTNENVLAAHLQLTIKTGVTTCNTGGFGTDGTNVYSAALGATGPGTKLIGDSTQGRQAGDRALAAGASEVLCAQVVLPLTSASTFQTKTTTATLTFNADQDTESLLAGTLTGTSMAASWTTVPGAPSYTLSRVAVANNAQFSYPTGVALDAAGNVYVADELNHRIRKVTAAGVVTTLAGGTQGFADGTGVAAQFDKPKGVAVDTLGNVYVGDSNNHRVRKVTAAGVVTTLAGQAYNGFADGTGAAAQFYGPMGLAVDAAGTVYVADAYNYRIRKVSSAGVVTTLAGSTQGFVDGNGPSAQFAFPSSVALDAAGNVYVADESSHRIRKVTAAGLVTTLAGSGTCGSADGSGAAASFCYPNGVAVDSVGNVYVADQYSHRIRKVTAGGVVTTLAGSDTWGFAEGTGAAASFYYPSGVAVDSGGTVFVADRSNSRIREVTAGGVVTTLAGGTYGFADTMVVPSVVYTGSALNFTDSTVVAGTSYTYTVTPLGRGTVSNTIGPFAP